MLTPSQPAPSLPDHPEAAVAPDPIAALVTQRAAAALTPAAEERIRQRCARLGHDRAGYARLLASDPLERQALVELCLDLTTCWWGHPHVVGDFENRFLPMIAKRQARTHRPELRVWVAGCATGEEVWSIAGSILKGISDLDCWEVSLLGTDLHTGALATASIGRYTETDVPPARLASVLDRAGSGQAVVQRRARGFTSFSLLNLADREWPAIGTFDAIICTDVIHRLAGQDGPALVHRLASRLRQAGTLYVDPDAARPTMEFPLRHPAAGVFCRPLA